MFSYSKKDERPWLAPFSRLPFFQKLSEYNYVLSDLRSFDYPSMDEKDAIPAWVNQEINLKDLKNVDLIISPFWTKDIAHLMLGFDFGQDNYLIWSAEMLYKTGDKYEIGRVLLKFHRLGYLWGKKSDFGLVREKIRQEKISYHRLEIDDQRKKKLFLDLVSETNNVNYKRQERYRFLTNSCTYKTLKHLSMIGFKINFFKKILILFGPAKIKKFLV